MGTPVSYDAWLTVYDSIRTLVQSLAPPIRQCSRFVVLRIDKICQKSIILIYTRSCEEPFQSMRSYGQFAPGDVMDRFQFLLTLGVDTLGSANRFNFPTPLLFVATEGSEGTEPQLDVAGW